MKFLQEKKTKLTEENVCTHFNNKGLITLICGGIFIAHKEKKTNHLMGIRVHRRRVQKTQTHE